MKLTFEYAMLPVFEVTLPRVKSLTAIFRYLKPEEVVHLCLTHLGTGIAPDSAASVNAGRALLKETAERLFITLQPELADALDDSRYAYGDQPAKVNVPGVAYPYWLLAKHTWGDPAGDSQAALQLLSDELILGSVIEMAEFDIRPDPEAKVTE